MSAPNRLKAAPAYSGNVSGRRPFPKKVRYIAGSYVENQKMSTLNVRKSSPDRMQSGPPKRLKLSSGGSRSLRLEGPVGHESLVETIYPDGTVLSHDGPKGEERMTGAVYPNGDRAHYIGERGEEQLKSIERSGSSKTDFFEGAHGREALRRTEWEDGRVRYWGGEHCCERALRTTYRNGAMKIYAGPRREEAIIAVQAHDNTITHHVGKKGEEQAWLKVLPSTGVAQVVSSETGNVTHSVTAEGKVLYHSKNGGRATYVPGRDFRKLKKETDAALAVLSMMNDAGHCKEQAMIELSNSLMAIHTAAEKCFVAHDGKSYDDGSGEILAYSEDEADEEEEACVFDEDDNETDEADEAGDGDTAGSQFYP